MRALPGLLDDPSVAERPFVALVSPAIRKLLGPSALGLNACLADLGALGVYTVDSGIPEFARLSAAAVRDAGGGLRVLSACPAAAPFLQKEFPQVAQRMLRVKSPMALRAQAALREKGIAEKGFALAVSPCSFKKMETGKGNSSYRVVFLGDFLKASRAAGIDPLSIPGRPYDGEVPPEGYSCRIAQEVAAELGKLGLEASSLTLGGREAARAWFAGEEARAALEPGAPVTIVELEFCEGGCTVGSAAGI